MIDYERRSKERLPDEVFEKIIERAAERAELRIYDQLYREVGKVFIRKGLLVLGAIASTYIALKWNQIQDFFR